MEPGYGEGSPCDREPTADVIVPADILEGGEEVFGPEIDRSDHDIWSPTNLDEDLDGWVTIQVDGEIDDLPSELQAVGWGIGPSPCEVEADGTAGRDDLVFDQGTEGSCGFLADEVDEALSEDCESLSLSDLSGRWVSLSQDSGGEHGKPRLFEDLHILGGWDLRRDIGVDWGDQVCGLFEVEVEEDAAAVVCQEFGDCLDGVTPTCFEEPLRVDYFGEAACADPPRRDPSIALQGTGLGGEGRGHHPLNKPFKILIEGQDGKEGGVLDVGIGGAAEQIRMDFSLLKPLEEGDTEPFGCRVEDGPSEGVMDSVWANGEGSILDGGKV